MGPPPQGFWFCAPWAWGIPEQRISNIGWLDMMEGGDGGAGLKFYLRFDPMRAGFDRSLLSLPVSALLSRLLGWGKNSSQTKPAIEGGGESASTVAFVAAAVALYLAALFVFDQQPRRPRRRRLSASALATPNSAVMPRALPTPDDGLKVLSWKDDCFENVIHATSVGAEDDEPVLVARVGTSLPDAAAGANADAERARVQSAKEQEEVERLRELWLSLVEREQRLELRLMELDGLREQEATVRELENRVSVAAVEARLLELKVSSLQEDNERLKAQVSELDAVRAELGRAKEKLRALKARVQGEGDEAQREALALRERVTELEKNGEERARTLAAEAEALRKANAGLEEEKKDLALRLQDAEQVSATVNLVLEEGIVEEANDLRETNETLMRQIEQLRSDHCAHVEELVYLKWVNACLRYELRSHDHHQPTSPQQEQDGAGGISAMDLSKSMSYRSSEKAKQMMLKYGNLELDGFDPSLFSPLHESLYGDGHDEDHRPHNDGGGEPARSPDMSTATAAAAPEKQGKHKFLRNIKKLLASRRKGHDGQGRRKSKKTPPNDEHLEKAMRWLSSHDALDGGSSYESTPLSSCERTPLSSVTTADSHARGHGREAAASRLLEAETARSRSDVGAAYRREATRYHALRPDHPTGVGPFGHEEPEKLRRYSDEMRSS